MLRTILVGLDGTSYCEAAVDLALRWAQRFDALAVGIGVIDEPSIRKSSAVPPGASYYKERSDDRRVSHARSQVETFLGHFSTRCAEASVACKLLEDIGGPKDRLLEEIQRYDLLMLGSQTHFHFETSDAACETLRQMLLACPRPVVTVPQNFSDGPTILVAYDGSIPAARSLNAFQSTGLAKDREVVILTSGSDHTQALKVGQRAVEFLGFHDIRARVSPVVGQRPADAILEKEKELQPGLVVMGAYGKPTYREFFLGSTTRRILANTTAPLFLHH